MASKSLARFVFDVGSSVAAILSVSTSPKGDLYLTIKSGERYSDLQYGPSSRWHNLEIKSQKYSIHPTTQHIALNIIQQSIKLSNDEVLRPRQRTEAIKIFQGFSHIYSRRYPNLLAPRYQVDRDVKNVKLGSFDPNLFSLFTSIFVGGRNIKFPNMNQPDTSIISTNYSQFKIILMWSLCPIYSNTSGHLRHSVTPVLPNDEKQAETTYIHPPMTAIECLNYHRRTCESLRFTYLKDMKATDQWPFVDDFSFEDLAFLKDTAMPRETAMKIHSRMKRS